LHHFWLAIFTTKGIGLGFFNPSFFFKFLKIIFTPDPLSNNASLTPNFPTQTSTTGMVSSKSFILVVMILQTSTI
jgi:hypothetical protein